MRSKTGGVPSAPPVGVSGNATVADGHHVDGDARVYGDARIDGNARVEGRAHVEGRAQVDGDAHVSGDAMVANAHVSGNARLSGQAWAYEGALVSGDARVDSTAWVGEKAHVAGTAHVGGNAWVRGDLRINKGHIAGEADVTSSHHVQTWRDSDGALWTVARSRVPAGFEAWKDDQPVVDGYPSKVEGLTARVLGDG